MNSSAIREAFLRFFERKQHQIVPSAPMVLKNDPTLMFTNAGMNQFKDIFLGNVQPAYPRVANSQKCLRVSGKHNDLEEVGMDTYHHTMFEMLGNWSFGDYFKKEAIAWAWEFLTEEMKINKDDLYVTIFEGDKSENLDRDDEAYGYWTEHVSTDRILTGNKKDNFWEMGDIGPCGPCSEIHVDIRHPEEKKKIPGKSLVNKGHPHVIEIWNLVFIQYNRKADGKLERLPARHVDTGMGFERLCMVVQGKQSNYDTDIFQDIIHGISRLTGKKYGEDPSVDVAMRVVSDHIRAISFAIADGQLPSNTRAGYVIRRILRRAVRYGYTYLGQEEPFLCRIVPFLARQMGEAYPELKTQEKLIMKVVAEEEQSFLRTLSSGIRRLDQIIQKAAANGKKSIEGSEAFELYDTYGFPLDLTALILREKGMSLDEAGFQKEMEQQKERSRQAAVVETDDWVIVKEAGETRFVGYDTLLADVSVVRYRKVTSRGKTFYHLVFDQTPFYAESGGQVGDSGLLESENEKIAILNTFKENNLIIHLAERIPSAPDKIYKATVDMDRRNATAGNHSATHLLHYALRKILGKHVEQKGSLVCPDYLRFDFVHFQKMTEEEIMAVEKEVNAMIRQNILLDERRNVPLEEAKRMGAMALFGEKYGESVRVIRFGESVELCGGTHVKATGSIGFFKIVSESAIAAGIRRIEAVTGEGFEKYFYGQQSLLNAIKEKLKHPQDLKKSIDTLLLQKEQLEKQVEAFRKAQQASLVDHLSQKIQQTGSIHFLAAKVEAENMQMLKDVAFQLKNKYADVFLVLAAEIDKKAAVCVMISENLVKERKLHAGELIREWIKEVDGSGGGQPFLATAGGRKPEGINSLLQKAEAFIRQLN